MIFRYLMVLFCFVSTMANAVPQELFYDGARAFQKGDFSQSVASYESAVEQGHANGSLFFNLGNAYYKNGQVGEAIDSYIKAFQYIPRDPDLKENFRFVLEKTKDQQTLTLLPHVRQSIKTILKPISFK